MAGLLLLGVGGVGLTSGGCRSSGRTETVAPTRGRTPARPLPAQVRAIWVARFHYHFPDDIRTIMRNCAADGFNTVLWQVRGEGTVAYPSRLEPWSAEYCHRDPGFDPLQVAVEEAHKHGLRIEAWVNTMPGWKGPKPPAPRDQLWHTHPEWFLRDAAGKRQPLGEFYSILNPCLPEVRRHIASVVDEIVREYDVDGVHLDYVRYAWETTKNARQLYPRDPETLRIFSRQTGKHPDDDRRAWDDWRANQLTRLVADIRAAVDRRRPRATLTAATWNSPQRGYKEYFQNGVAWLRTGLIDAALPMAYTDDLARFEGYVGAYRTLAPQGRVVPGIGIYKHDTAEQMARQLEYCRRLGGDFALFSYDSIHPVAGDRGRNGRSKVAPEKIRQRQMRVDVLRRVGG